MLSLLLMRDTETILTNIKITDHVIHKMTIKKCVCVYIYAFFNVIMLKQILYNKLCFIKSMSHAPLE